MRSSLRFTFYLMLLALTLFVVGNVSAQTREVTDDEVNEVAKDLYCPVCENTPLDVCPTQACADWRELIRTQLAEGKTKEDVFNYFTRQYGDGVLSNPPKRGFNILLLVFPLAALLLGGGLFARYLLRLRHEHEVTPATAASTANNSLRQPAGPAAKAEVVAVQPVNPAEANPDYIAKIEEELLARK